MTLSFCFLLRVKSIEQISHESPGELGKSIGLDRIPEVKTLRGKIAVLSDENQSEQWLGKLSKGWMQSSPELAGVLYIDGHQNPYYGTDNKLPRKYMSRLRLALRATTDYWVNDKIGQPFFSVSKSINEGMISVIKNQIVPRLKDDVPNQPDTEQLTEDRHLHRFMIVCDREIYSNDFFLDMWEERIAVCTYNKNVKDKWNPEEFKECEIQNEEGETEMVLLAERIILIEGKESEKLPQPQPCISFIQTEQGTIVKVGRKHTKKKRQLWVREIRKLTDNEHQTSIVTTNYKLSIALIGMYMFARWCQENFFKYMMQNLNIDSLISYLKTDIPDTIELINPQWRDLEKKIRKLYPKLNKLKGKFSDLIMDDDLQEKEVKKYERKKSQIMEDISIFEFELQDLKTKKSETPKKITFADLPENDRFQAVYNSRKHFVDTIKYIVYRAEVALANSIKPYTGKPKEARSLITQILKTDADFKVDQCNKILEINLHHLSTKRDNMALGKLCKELNETQTIFPGTNLRLIYNLVSR
jgi:hypothetical protein